MDFLYKTYFNNPVWMWLITAGGVVAVFVFLKIAKGIIAARAADFSKKTETEWDDLAADLIKGTNFFLLLALSVYAGSQFLVLAPLIMFWIGRLAVVVLFIQGAIWGGKVLEFIISRHVKRKMERDPGAVTTVKALGFIGKLALYSIVLLLILDNIGVDVTTLIAGLGVGGIAVALALQNILGDLFSSFSIMLDKPFVIGDFVIVDDYLGTVEHIGLKTTRIRSLSGEQIVFSNTDLLSSRIRNYKRMYERRVVSSIGVTYQTPLEKLKAIPTIIREAIEAQEAARFDRAHFKAYGDFSLNFEFVYYVKSPDYNAYMDVQQEINLIIYRRFDEEKIEFAYPTQTLFVNREER